MKRLVFCLLGLSLLMFACSIGSTPVPPTTSVPVTEPPVTQPPTLPPTEPPTVPPTQPPAPVTNVTCNELKLFLDPALGSGYSCNTVPEENSGGPVVYPQYTDLVLNGYPLGDRFFNPRIYVFPVQAYAALAPDFVNTNVTALQVLTSGGPMGDKSLPLLPQFNAAQEFRAQYMVLQFASGSGIRYLTQYSQFADPINNYEMFYSFQGLTADGNYWISGILPISNPILPEDSKNPPNGQSWDDFNNNFETYLPQITDQLNAQNGASFTPTLAQLDALVSSIQVQP